MGSRSSSASSTANSYTDGRQVNDASGGGIIGTGNTVNVQSVDAAAAAAQAKIVAEIAAASAKTTDTAIIQAGTFNTAALGRMFDLTGKTTAAAFESNAAALGIVADLFKTKTDAEAGNKTVMMVAAAGALGLVLLAKGR